MCSLARRLNIDVDLLRSTSSEYLSSKHVQPNQYYDDEDCEYRNNSNATATSSFTFFSHKAGPPWYSVVNKGANEREYARLLAHWFEVGQTYFRFKIADLRAL